MTELSVSDAMRDCPTCGRAVPARLHACGYCGAALTIGWAPVELRRRVTIVQSDLKGSTSLGEKLDPESLREVLTLYFDQMRAVFEGHGGTIEKIIGDAIVAVFGLPIARDDDALRAVAAASEAQRTLAALNEQIERTWGVRLTNRTGIATGDVVVGAARVGEHILTGSVVQLASKLEQSAPAMEVLVGEPTRALVGDDVMVEAAEAVLPKGWSEPVPAFRLVCVNADAEGEAAAGAPAQSGVRVCQNCGESNPDEFAYCGSCGRPLTAATRAQERRKTVTIVFSDLRATDLEGEALEPPALRDTMARAFDVARRVLEAHGGTVEKFIGDAVMAVFGLPVRHEDDALRATRAAHDMREALAALAASLEEEGIRLRVATGVNTGEVVAGDASLGQRLVTGDAVNVAARLEQAAPAHQVFIGELTYRLVRDAADVDEVEPLTLKGKAQPVRAYQLLGVRAGEETVRHLDTPMVGREEELGLLHGAYGEARAERRCTMVTILGEAGVGKTRLTREFLDRVRDGALVLSGRCLAYGDGITFWPIVEVARQAANIRDGDPPESARRRLAEVLGEGNEAVADRVASAVGLLQTPFQVAELFWGIRRFLEIMAQDRPLVVLFDDIHWAEPTFLDLIGHLVDATQGAPLMLLCTARNALLEDYPDWAARPREARIELRPLSAADAGQVVGNLLGQAGLDASVRGRIVDAAEGNPLFVEQLLSMLIDSQALRYEGGRWVPTGDLSQLAIPPSIDALLAARLDQLPAPERVVAETASVIGLSFARAAVRTLVPDDIRTGTDGHLGALVQKQLVRLGEVESETDPGYRFQHGLVRDAAYRGLLKRTRADLHERFVDWADVVNAEAGRAQEFEEILGYHLEQAYRYRTELGPLDDHGVAVGVRASERLSSAGSRAFARGDMPAAANLLQRAAGVIADDHEARPRLLLRLGEARMEMGQFEEAGSVLDTALRVAQGRGDRGMEANSRLVRLLVRYITDPGSIEGSVEDAVNEAIGVLEQVGDLPGLVTAWRFFTNLHAANAQWGAAEQSARRWMEYARRADDHAMEVRAGTALAMAALFGPTPVPEAIGRCEEIIARSAGDRHSEALVLRDLAHLRAMRGEFEDARSAYRRARRTLEELGWTNQAALTSLDSGPIELLAGDPVAAEAELRRDHATLDGLGERNYISTVAAVLAEALYQQGRLEEAGEFVDFSENVAAPDDVTTQFLWRGVRGKLLVRAGAVDRAMEVAREAVRLSGTSDEPIAPANALMDLAEVLCLAGRRPEAAGATDQAIELYEAKGNVVSARQARLFRQSLVDGEPAGGWADAAPWSAATVERAGGFGVDA